MNTKATTVLMLFWGWGIDIRDGTHRFDAVSAWSPPLGRIPSRQTDIRKPPEGLIFDRQRNDFEDDFMVEHFASERRKRSFSLDAVSTTHSHAGSTGFLEAELVKLQGDHTDSNSFPRSDESLWTLSFPKRTVEERVEQAYREWCQYYDKIPNPERQKTFTTNFFAVKEYHERTGRPLILNELADLTEAEYLQQQSPVSGPSVSPSKDRIQRAYREWCEYYGKVQDEKRFVVFAANFVAVDKYHKQTMKPLVLNEFADMTEEEYQRHLSASSHFVTSSDQKVPYEEEMNDIGTNIIVNAHSINGINKSNNQDPHGFAYSRDQVDPITYPLSTQTPLGPSVPNPVLQPPVGETSLATMKEVVSRLQSTVSALTAVISDSLASGIPPTQQNPVSAPPPPPMEPQPQPLDELVMDVLQQHDTNLGQLEDSVEGLRDVQGQSSDLIQMISQNQMQMAEMMSVLQKEVSNVQAELRKSRQDSLELRNRVSELEQKLCDFEARLLQEQQSHVKLVTSAFTTAHRSPLQNKRMELKPNPVGVMFRPAGLSIGSDSEDPPKLNVDPLDDKITIRPIP
jgi:hypothetical protein